MALGTLYGVGVGPGAPDLMTLRAVNVLRSVDVIAIPRKDENSQSVAWRIAEPSVGAVEGQERLFLNFPMTKKKDILRAAWDVAFKEVGLRLEQGKSVGFITEGDPLVYSTFIYLLNEVPERWEGLELEIVPGVSSLSAVPAVCAMPLADGQQRIAVLPATYGVDDLLQVLDTFDTVLLMKVTNVLPLIIEALEKKGLLENAVFVSNATVDGKQRIERDLRKIVAEGKRCDYFSMVVVKHDERAGVLVADPARR